jgi:hypothetical protein
VTGSDSNIGTARHYHVRITFYSVW